MRSYNSNVRRSDSSKLGLAIAAFVSANAFCATEIADPEKFVADVYKQYVAAQRTHKDYNAPEDIYTPRLAALFAKDKKMSKGEVGCIEFDFWVNGQDWKLTNLNVSSQDVPGHADQKIVVSTFGNLGTPKELHFHFVQQRGRWLLDDVDSVKGEKWTLSKLLNCWP